MSMAIPAPAGRGRRDLVRKFGWTSAASVVAMLAGLASVLILTRFLVPADYGIYGIALMAIAAGEVLTGGVLSSPIEQKADVTRADLNSAFWANIALALACGAVTLPVAGLIARAAGYEAAIPVIGAACLLMLITATGIVPESLLRRRQAFRQLAKVGVAAALSGLAAGIVLALMGAGVWSLIGLEFVRRVILVASNFRLARWHPDGGPDVKTVRAALPFVSGMLAANALGRADRLAPQIAATVFFGPEGLGLLYVATRIADQIQSFVAQPVGAMALPVLSDAAREPARFHALMADSWRAIAIASFPMLAGLAAIAPLLVPSAVGDAFSSVGVICAITVLANLRVVSSKVNIAATQAAGKALTASASLATSFGAHLLLLAVFAPLGVAAIAFASLLRGWLTWPLAAWFVKATTGFAVSRQMAILVPPLAASLAMAAVVYALSGPVSAAFPVVPALGILILAGCLFYASALWLADPWVRACLANGAWRGLLKKENVS
ncbi:MAG: oligosaccharide flippase family protein [Hyphomonas sp.]|uniref:oligosaccharide flippase family protein n=1 Tax=Hyphomonas sp. TaxID=87 RepID=UPI0034A0AB88